jgi:hypothetical protein
MANQRGRRKIPNPPFIHATTILYHFAPLSTTCTSIIVQKLGIGKKFLRFSFKKEKEFSGKNERQTTAFASCLPLLIHIWILYFFFA